MGVLTFLGFGPKYFFWAYLVQKIQICLFREKFAP